MDESHALVERAFLPKPPPNAFFGLIVGQRNSGKSTLVTNLLLRREMMLGWFDKVCLMSPTIRDDPTLQCVLLPPEQICAGWSPAFLENIYAKQEATAPNKRENVLVIVDDCVSEPNFKDNDA